MRSKKNTEEKFMDEIVICGPLVSLLLSIFYWYWRLSIAT